MPGTVCGTEQGVGKRAFFTKGNVWPPGAEGSQEGIDSQDFARAKEASPASPYFKPMELSS